MPCKNCSTRLLLLVLSTVLDTLQKSATPGIAGHAEPLCWLTWLQSRQLPYLVRHINCQHCSCVCMGQLQDITKVYIAICMVCAELYWGQASLHSLAVPATATTQSEGLLLGFLASIKGLHNISIIGACTWVLLLLQESSSCVPKQGTHMLPSCCQQLALGL